MNVDRASLTDLGVLPAPDGAWPLGHLLDGTHARPSSEALRRVLQQALPNAEAIRVRQQLLDALAPLSVQVDWSTLCALAKQTESYLDSNYVILPAGTVALAAFAWSHADIVRHVAEQVRSVLMLMEQVEALLARLRALPPDPAAVAITDAVHAVVSHPARVMLRDVLRESGAGTQQVARHDAVLRDRTRGDEPDARMSAELRTLVSAVWELDALCALAHASAEIRRLGGVLPVITDRGAALELDGLRHPLLTQSVANDVRVAHDERVVYVTGPNMAGKSTLLRAVGVAAFLAHRGVAIPASRAVVPWYDVLAVSLQVRDDLQRGESLYLAEVRRVRSVVERVAHGDCVLAILDEVFRGTNVMDASEATALLVDGLSAARWGTFVVASHLADVGAARTTQTGVSCWYMDVALAESGPSFSYRLVRGVSAVHLGMVLLDREGVGPLLRRLRDAWRKPLIAP